MRKVIVDTSERLQQVGPTSLVALEQVRRRLMERGISVIDMGRFNPDLEIDPQLLEQVHTSLSQLGPFRPADAGLEAEFRQAAAAWFQSRFGVKINPRRGVLPTSGVKQSLQLLMLALVNPGDRIAIPDPAYPVYRAAAVYAGGSVVTVPLRSDNDYLPNLARLDSDRTRPRILILNYPHNPTSRPPDRAFFTELVRWARRRNVILVHDFAYGEIYYDSEPPISLLSIPGARQVAVELHSFSFTYNLPALKLGFAVGHPEILAALDEAQSSVTSGQSALAMSTGVQALAAYDRIARANNEEYTRRRSALAAGLDLLGWTCRRPMAGAFFWVPVPGHRHDERLARRILTRAGVLVAPGSAFGECGEGYLRMSVVIAPDVIRTAFERIARLWPQRLKQMRKTWGPSDSSA